MSVVGGHARLTVTNGANGARATFRLGTVPTLSRLMLCLADVALMQCTCCGVACWLVSPVGPLDVLLAFFRAVFSCQVCLAM